MRPGSRAGCAWLAAALGAALGNAQGPTTAALRSYSRASEVLSAAVEAIGGREALLAATTVRREMEGDWIGSGQDPRPHPVSAPTLTVPPANSHTRLVTTIDYGSGRWLEEAVESDATGDSITRKNVLGEGTGFETITYRDERPFYRPYTEEEMRSLRVLRFRRHPEGLLRMALARPETLQWMGTADELGGRQRVISFADPLGIRVALYFDAGTHLLIKAETLREHAIAGDSSAEVVYLDHRPAGSLRLPFHVVDRTAGIPVEEMRARSIEIGAALPVEGFAPPADFARVELGPPEPELSELGGGLYLIRGPYNVVFAAFRDHVVLFEAPLGSAYAETCLELVRRASPDRPLGQVVATHFHYDHVAGLRPLIAAGVAILTTPDAEGVIQQVAASHRTMFPDALSRAPRAPQIETVAGRRVLDDGTQRVEIYDVGPTAHAAQLLVPYFPRQRVLFVADLWDPISTELDVAGSDAATLAQRIRELGLRVERIIPVHGVPTTLAALERGVALRRKYVP